jgi:hypothetical protein
VLRIQKKSYFVEQSKIEGIAEACNIQIIECFITILSHTIQDLAEGASSSGMTAGVSVFVQKSGTLRVIQIMAQFWKLFESSLYIGCFSTELEDRC